MITKKMTLFCFLLGCLFVISGESFLYAEAQKTLKDVIAEKVAIKRQIPHAGFNTREIFTNYDGHSVVAQAINLTKDPNEPVRNFGYLLLAQAGTHYDDPNLRKAVVSTFVNGLADKEEDITTFSAKMLLKDYQKEDFSEEAKGKLKQHFNEILSKQSQGYYAMNIILLVGAADMQTEMDRLQWLIDQIHEPLQPFGAQTPRWHEEAFTALKAKARMGDQEAIQKCILLVDAVTDEDFKVITLLKHIAYIRQPKAVDYIKQYLYSDKKARDLGPNFPGAPYFYMAAHCLEEMVVGFPTHLEVSKFYQEKISTDPVFRKQWPSYVDYFGEHWRNWFEAQTSIEIIR